MMHLEFSGSFPDYTIFICKFKIDESFFFIHGTFLVYKLETFKHCKEVKHIMIMIIAIIYIFLSYMIFDQQLKITFRKSWAPPWKNPLPPFYSPPFPKNSKVQVPPFLTTLKNFQPPPAERVGGGRGTQCDILVRK